MRKENVVNNKGLSSRKSFVRDLPSAKSLLNKEKQPYCMKQAEGPGQRPAGTTIFFNNGGFTLYPAPISRTETLRDDEARSGFTLIELLVVVLIIGILAAVAVPQYQKAVWKSRYVQAKTMGESLAQAEEVYYLANGEYTQDISALSIDVPATSCNSNNGICSFSWGYCYLLGSYNFVRCYVYKNGAAYLEYERWLKSKERICATFSTNASDMSNQICKAETGLPSPSTTQDTRLLWNYF